MEQDHELTERFARIYGPVLTALGGCRPEGQGFSFPLFMAPSPQYAAAKLELMIVGQETHSWYSHLHDLTNYPHVGAIQHRYSEFALGHGYRSSPFWQAVLKIQAALAPAVPRFGFVWRNLFLCDQHKTMPFVQWHDALRAHSPFRAELEILKPDLIVCFTGRHYDYTLRTTCLKPPGTPQAKAMTLWLVSPCQPDLAWYCALTTPSILFCAVAGR